MIGRWRATLAHEASHVFLHRYLFDPEMAQLVGRTGVVGAPSPGQDDGQVRCLHRDITPNQTDWSLTRRHSDWREVQANRAMAALLMPQRIFGRLALREMQKLRLKGLLMAVSDADMLSAAMANLLQVSKQAASIRLESARVLSQDQRRLTE